jgi:Ca2+-binding EF-hand superfamily protein
MKAGTAQRKAPIEEKKRPLTLKEEREVKLAFELYDLTGCGVITKDDALTILMTLGFKVSREDTIRLNAII